LRALDQALALQDLLVLVKGSLGKAAHLDNLFVWLVRMFLDKRQNAVLCS